MAFAPEIHPITRSGGHNGGLPQLANSCPTTTAQPRNGLAAFAWADVSRRT